MRTDPSRAPASARPVLATAALAACLLASSCGHGSLQSSIGPTVSPTGLTGSTPTTMPPHAATTTPIRPPIMVTAEITGPRQGSLVSWAQMVTGLVMGLPAGMSAWLVIQPAQPTGYWPQPGPLHPDPNGRYVTPATLGLNAMTDHGEQFILMIVEATTAASQQFKQFIIAAQSTGMPGLPDGTQVLTEISVTRS